MLPIVAYRDRIVSALNCCGSVIVTAPPGTGKSTQIPQFFLERATPHKRVIVLEPRRIAARSLAHRVAQECGCRIGETVGYQVRFEREASDATRILFCTYGTFLQLLQSDPEAGFASLIIFDEFHERTLEADAALAWIRSLAATLRPELGILVLSATLETRALQEYLAGCAVVTVKDTLHPVDIRYCPPGPQEPLWLQVERAFGALADGAGGSILVFLPGVYEIERTADALAIPCKRRGYRVVTLHGRLPVTVQQEALRMPQQEPCVVLATNVAETSLTIPGVCAVIDSGLARTAAYDPARDRNTLYLARISRDNAAQRAGRAGRLGPGTCVRLWSADDERAMPESIVPEVLRLDLGRIFLTLGAYATGLAKTRDVRQFPFHWLTPPPIERVHKAIEDLARCGLVELLPDAQQCSCPLLNAKGIAVSRLPLDPRLGALLLECGREERDLTIAMAALWESGEIRQAEGRDLFAWAEAFLANPRSREFGYETRETFEQLRAMVPSVRSGGGETAYKSGMRESISRIWMRFFRHRIAGRAGDSAMYECGDGRSVRLIVGGNKNGGGDDLPPVILALFIHEQAGRSQQKKVTVPLYLPLETTWIAQEFPGELVTSVECRWDEAKKRVVVEEMTRWGTVPCGRREITERSRYHDEAAALLAQRCLAGDWDWRAVDPGAAQFLLRMRLVAAAFPELQLPAMDETDWELLFRECCAGKRSLDELRDVSVLNALREYIGPHRAAIVERKAPDRIVLPSGKKGRITYFENSPPELSARLGDLIGHPATFFVADGRVRGTFDILAPNYRTVQKTRDLGTFWKTVYPAIKNELRRKYPKHPWP